MEEGWIHYNSPLLFSFTIREGIDLRTVAHLYAMTVLLYNFKLLCFNVATYYHILYIKDILLPLKQRNIRFRNPTYILLDGSTRLVQVIPRSREWLSMREVCSKIAPSACMRDLALLYAVLTRNIQGKDFPFKFIFITFKLKI